jgi:YVTN family beta-propeller protein
VVDVATRKVRDYVLVGSRAWGATLNRDESMLVVVNGLSDDISLVDTKTNKVLRSVAVGRVPHTAVIDD